jgi:hypothetical protein
MDEQQRLALKPELDRFLDQFAPLFGREETQVLFGCGSTALGDQQTM